MIHELSSEAIEAVNAIYATVQFSASRPGLDRNFGYRDENGQLGALGRIQQWSRQGTGNCHEVGGFWVRDDLRGGGLARAMVGHVLGQLAPSQSAWCIPFEHLIGFYRGFGLRAPGRGETVPPEIKAKLARCRQICYEGQLQRFDLLYYDGRARRNGGSV